MDYYTNSIWFGSEDNYKAVVHGLTEERREAWPVLDDPRTMECSNKYYNPSQLGPF